MIDLTSNRISAVMTAEAFAGTKTELQKVSQDLSFLVKLTQEETEAMYNMSDADKTFVRNCITEMNGATDILPPYLKSEEVGKDLACGDQLLELENTLVELLTNVRRNRMLVNYEAYTGASVFYHLVGAAARSGSAPAKAMYDRLKSYHVNKKKGGRSSVATPAKSGDTRAN
jgi:hypothetical protein